MLADPFIKAGLDVNKLDKNEWTYKPSAESSDMGSTPNLLIRMFNIDHVKAGPSGNDNALAALERILKRKPRLVGYHEELQHYQVKPAKNYKFEWTKKLGVNPADMAFVLPAEPLVRAGLDVNKIGEGWKFQAAKKTEMGKTPDLLIKPFTLK